MKKVNKGWGMYFADRHELFFLWDTYLKMSIIVVLKETKLPEQ